MKLLNKMKAVLLFFILGIAVIGCQNTPSSSSQNDTITSKSMVYMSLTVEGMTCAGCENTVQGALTAIDGIDSAFASHIDKQVRVLVDSTQVSLKEMQEAIIAKGYDAGELIK